MVTQRTRERREGLSNADGVSANSGAWRSGLKQGGMERQLRIKRKTPMYPYKERTCVFVCLNFEQTLLLYNKMSLFGNTPWFKVHFV